ncbi:MULTISPECIES: LacI family DNA-binding transcriptional regulator [Paraburkholderia]|jgi:LacI family transcriptional regulator|uniref:LacI family DNA-binding transcriptional regulator n=1 Tax=Paraburkholderia hospita TaxID=169430 RepID=A0AAJ4SZQ3_9BURK|nr:LacI family DNA-binding transcriptional regulator [Paraburkholderia hospita]EUC18042.1 transcriptional regulator, LacI family [Burkholderia sp. BT03]AUT68136.1 LacI family DNA-binding transcriptional regulator [Paraburkholderia hospita]AXE98273.1 LacI family transcriptional regulator [Paraburkholderia hospita]OUL79032.1 LacI family transcriptional regulator [Paraburkholderia hospita]SEI10759.1 transcriptional regulator, LacI family [Paraburkholderia hospita]
MATIKDVAAIAGVSFTTVSHVVNNTRPVSADVRSKVELAIRQLNYVPSAVARSLKARSTATIGLVVPNSTNPYFAEMARGIEDGCARNGYCLFFCNSDDDPAKQRNYLRVLQEKRVDGLIVASAGDDATLAKTLADSREPLVIVDRNIEGISADLVQIDHEKGAYLATRHLLQLGHSKIGCITGPVETAVSAMRVHGFIRAMAERGIEIAPNGIVESDFSGSGGYRAAGQLFDTVQPTAIFAGNDMMGIGALRAAAERGLRVPQDCSVIGFDDIELGRFTYPALSTVGQSVRALGEMAAQTLIERISGTPVGTPTGAAFRRRVIAPRLILRESTAAFAGARRGVKAA